METRVHDDRKELTAFQVFMGDMQGKETETPARPVAPGEGLEA
jgi:hypothetical protein